jgi:5,5'-dehydrodivanillate O-demethylase
VHRSAPLALGDLGLGGSRLRQCRVGGDDEEGVDPMFTFRDPAKNQRIDLPNERKKHHNSEGIRSWIMRTHAAYSPIAEDVIRIFDKHKPAPTPLRAVS